MTYILAQWEIIHVKTFCRLTGVTLEFQFCVKWIHLRLTLFCIRLVKSRLAQLFGCLSVCSSLWKNGLKHKRIVVDCILVIKPWTKLFRETTTSADRKKYIAINSAMFASFVIGLIQTCPSCATLDGHVLIVFLLQRSGSTSHAIFLCSCHLGFWNIDYAIFLCSCHLGCWSIDFAIFLCSRHLGCWNIDYAIFLCSRHLGCWNIDYAIFLCSWRLGCRKKDYLTRPKNSKKSLLKLCLSNLSNSNMNSLHPL